MAAPQPIRPLVINGAQWQIFETYLRGQGYTVQVDTTANPPRYYSAMFIFPNGTGGTAATVGRGNTEWARSSSHLHFICRDPWPPGNRNTDISLVNAICTLRRSSMSGANAAPGRPFHIPFAATAGQPAGWLGQHTIDAAVLANVAAYWRGAANAPQKVVNMWDDNWRLNGGGAQYVQIWVNMLNAFETAIQQAFAPVARDFDLS